MLLQTAMPPALRRWSTALVALVGLWLLVPSTVEAQRRARLDTQIGAEIMQHTETGETVARPVTVVGESCTKFCRVEFGNDSAESNKKNPKRNRRSMNYRCLGTHKCERT